MSKFALGVAAGVVANLVTVWLLLGAGKQLLSRETQEKINAQ